MRQPCDGLLNYLSQFRLLNKICDALMIGAAALLASKDFRPQRWLRDRRADNQDLRSILHFRLSPKRPATKTPNLLQFLLRVKVDQNGFLGTVAGIASWLPQAALMLEA